MSNYIYQTNDLSKTMTYLIVSTNNAKTFIVLGFERSEETINRAEI